MNIIPLESQYTIADYAGLFNAAPKALNVTSYSCTWETAFAQGCVWADECVCVRQTDERQRMFQLMRGQCFSLEPHYSMASKGCAGRGTQRGYIWRERERDCNAMQPLSYYHQSVIHTHALRHTRKRADILFMPTSTGERVAHHRVMDELSFVQSGHTVHVETIQTDHVTLGTLSHQNRTPAGRSTADYIH